mgnify:CR=1 FL=1
MYWEDEGYLLSKNIFNENSIIIETFTLNHGKCSGIVYGGTSRKLKKYFQIGNKILLNWKSKGENKVGYFNTELIKPISPLFFDDKKRSICVLSATSILKILLPERQINKKIYNSFELLVDQFKLRDWIKLYIFWELSLIKELGFEINFFDKDYTEDRTKIPKLLLDQDNKKLSNIGIKEALTFNKSLIMKNFILPHGLRLPLSRNILEKYYN